MTAWANSGGAIRQLFGRGSIYTAALAIQLSIGLLVLPFVTRLLTPMAYGLVSSALVVLQLLTYLAAAGIPAAITRFFFTSESGPRASRRLISSTAFVALLVALIADLSGPLWSRVFISIPYDSIMRLSVWSVVPFAIAQACQALLRAEDRPVGFVAVAALNTALGQVLGLAAITLGYGPTGYVAGVALGYSAGALAGLVMTTPPRPTVRDGRLVLSALKFGLPTVPHSIAFFTLSAGDRVVVERLLGLEAVGQYTVAYLIGATGIAVIAALNNSWAVMIYKASPEDRWDLLASTTSAVTRVSGFIAGGLAIGAPIALAIAAPQTYQPDVLIPVTSVVALSVVPYIAYLGAAHVIFQLGHTQVVAWLTPIVAGLNIGLNFLLVPHLGLAGAALATLLAYTAQATGLQLLARRWVKIDWPRADLTRSLAMAGMLVALGALLPASEYWIWLRATIGLVLLMGLIAQMRVLMRHRPTEEIS